MKYSNNHKKIIAELFSKAGMEKEKALIMNNEKYDFEIANAIREALRVTNTAIVNNAVLLDAARRYENRHCPVFKECDLLECEGCIWCKIYNLGGSHGFTGSRYMFLGKRVSDIPISKRREIMLTMLAEQEITSYDLMKLQENSKFYQEIVGDTSEDVWNDL